MRPVVQLHLVSDIDSNRTRIRDAVDAEVASVPGREYLQPIVSIPWHDGLFINNATVACPTAQDADSLFSRVQSLWTTGGNAGRILTGSWARRVDSFEDEGLADVIVSGLSK